MIENESTGTGSLRVKIGIVIERFEAWRGGAETSTLELGRLLKNRGHSIHVVTTTTAPSSPDFTLHRIPAQSLLRPLRTAAFIRRATAFLQRNQFDIVHAISPLPSADVYQPRGGLLGETMMQRRHARLGPSPDAQTGDDGHECKARLADLERAVFRAPPFAVSSTSRGTRTDLRGHVAASPRRLQQRQPAQRRRG
jgi:hypothetical protein